MKGSFFLLLTMFLFYTFNCSTSTESQKDYTEFKIKVDRIEAPQNINFGEKITFKLFGTVGRNGCYEYSHIYENVNIVKANIIVWGKHYHHDKCPTVMVYLEGEEYSVYPGQKGIFVLNIFQPDNTVISDTVFVQ